MSYSDFYSTKSEKEVKSHIYTLFSLAAADGILHDKEIQMICTIAQDYGVSEEKLLQLSKEDPNPKDYQKPQSTRRKVEYIFDLILVMMADGKMTEDEFEVARKIGLLMHIGGTDFEMILEMMNEYTNLTHDKDEIVSRIHQRMKHRL